MKSKYIRCLFFSLSIILLNSCKKLVDVNPPITSLVTTSVFNSDNTAIAAQLAVYAQMQRLPWLMDAISALSADEFTNYSTAQYFIDLYKNALSADVDGNDLTWPVIYPLIYQENAILENIPGSAGVSGNTKKITTGEAKFMRAYMYFHLVNFYGDVPLILTTNYKQNSVMSRTPKAIVYQQMIQDLKDAQGLLSDKYLNATDTATTNDRVRPTTWAAAALLARIYLYTGKYDSAEAEASIVMNNTKLFGLSDLDKIFFANSKEAIFQLLPPSSWAYTYEGNNFVLSAVPGGNSDGNNTTISPQLLAAFEAGDNRQSQWVGAFINGTDTFYYPNKYQDNSLTATDLREYSMILRLGELYLVRAEARAQQGKLSDAINDVNSIRTRAGLQGLDPTLNQGQLLAAILHERQVELFSENHRWFDLKRTNSVDAVMNVIAPQKGEIWNTNNQLYPLPLTEIQTGINLSQNPGY